jgi:ABC-type glycerol-3-phosphate transport system permease component
LSSRAFGGGGLPARSSAQALMVAVSVLTIYPLYFVLVTAFKTQSEYATNRMLPPAHPTLHNFGDAFRDGELLRWIANSVIVTVGAVALSTLIAAVAAYPLSRRTFPGRRIFIGLNVTLMVIPPVVLVVPLFLLFVNLHLINSRLGVILIYIGLLIPFSIFILVNFFATIPRSLEEAALIDGASTWRILRFVIAPLAAPAIVTVMVVNAVWVWNELLIAVVFLQDNNARTLTAGLTFFQGRFLTNDPLVMTGALLASLPMLALYVVGQRFFVRGLSAGFGK